MLLTIPVMLITVSNNRMQMLSSTTIINFQKIVRISKLRIKSYLKVFSSIMLLALLSRSRKLNRDLLNQRTTGQLRTSLSLQIPNLVMSTLRKVEPRSSQNVVKIARANSLQTIIMKKFLIHNRALSKMNPAVEVADEWAIIVHHLLNMCHPTSKPKWKRQLREPWSALKYQMSHLCQCN